MNKEQIYLNLEKINTNNVCFGYEYVLKKNVATYMNGDEGMIIFDPNTFLSENSCGYPMYELAFTYASNGIFRDMCLFPDFAAQDALMENLRKRAYEFGIRAVPEIAKNVAKQIFGEYDKAILEYSGENGCVIYISLGDNTYIINNVFSKYQYDCMTKSLDIEVEFAEIAPNLFVAIN